MSRNGEAGEEGVPVAVKQRRSRARFRPVGSKSAMVVALFEEAHRQRMTDTALCTAARVNRIRLSRVRNGLAYPDVLEMDRLGKALAMTLTLKGVDVYRCLGVVTRWDGGTNRCRAICRNGVITGKGCDEPCDFVMRPETGERQ